MKPLKKTIVFMFYCKDVKYDMCELKKKNHDKKNKICKEFDDLTHNSLNTFTIHSQITRLRLKGTRLHRMISRDSRFKKMHSYKRSTTLLTYLPCCFFSQ